MDIHKPKPVHGWREFLGEIGVIVCGVLIAIALEQTVEALRHRAEAKEMVRKLDEEGVENRHVIDYDLGVCRQGLAAADKDIAIVSETLRAGRLPEATKIEPMPPRGLYQPADAAWITIRDSALLPVMPKLTIDNAWKVDTTLDAMIKRGDDTSNARRQLQALIDDAHERPMDIGLAHDLLAALNVYRQGERSYCFLAQSLREDGELALAGKRIDIVKDLQPIQATPR